MIRRWNFFFCFSIPSLTTLYDILCFVFPPLGVVVYDSQLLVVRGKKGGRGVLTVISLSVLSSSCSVTFF